jgi:hypothetical protein
VNPWLSRIALPVVVVVGALVPASTVWANSSVSINSGNVPTTAAAVATHQCSADQGGGPYANLDVWVFVLPGSHATSGDFVSLTANFDTDGNGTADTAKQLPADGTFLNGGPATSKAVLTTPAGWTLVSADATISGSAQFFTLSHTCPAGTVGTPPPSGTPTPSTSPSTSPSSSGSPSGSGPGTPTSPATSTGTAGGGLPVTGVALTGVIVAALAFIAAGIGLVLARRRGDRSQSL